MKLTVLVDNNTYIDHYLRGEPGFSALIEADGKRILFDAGYSGLFAENAAKLGQDVTDIDAFALSHGHLDHAWGLIELIRLMTEATLHGIEVKKPLFAAHPQALESRSHEKLPEIGSLLSFDKLARHFTMELTPEPSRLTPSVVFLGEIPRLFDFEAVGDTRLRRDAEGKPDTMSDDTGLALITGTGLVVVSGCAHSGICNMVEHARKVTGVDRVTDVIGGFHLLRTPRKRLMATADYLAGLELDALHACHCTDLAAKIALAQKCPLREVGVGLGVEYPV